MATPLIHNQSSMLDALGGLFHQIGRIIAIAVAADQECRGGNLVESVPKIKGIFSHEHSYHTRRVLDTYQGSEKPQEASPEPLPDTRVGDGRCQ